MHAKEATRKTKTVIKRQQAEHLAKVDKEQRAEKASATKQFPNKLKQIFNDIEKTANTGNNFVRATIYHNASLASMLTNALRKEGYKVTMFSDGGYNYDGAYLGPTTEWSLHISW